jgi:methylated-DNA-protein-cysteine methyltransferase related protein
MDVYSRIYTVVSTIPSGNIMSYGSVARVLGMPRGARLVGWALRNLQPDTKIPWQRVVNRFGQISIINPHLSGNLQAELLQSEGLIVNEVDGVLQIANPPWWEPTVELPATASTSTEPTPGETATA